MDAIAKWVEGKPIGADYRSTISGNWCGNRNTGQLRPYMCVRCPTKPFLWRTEVGRRWWE